MVGWKTKEKLSTDRFFVDITKWQIHRKLMKELGNHINVN